MRPAVTRVQPRFNSPKRSFPAVDHDGGESPRPFDAHVAYIDASANADANALAQQAADEKAGAFTCGKDEAAIVGKRGRGAELAAP